MSESAAKGLVMQTRAAGDAHWLRNIHRSRAARLLWSDKGALLGFAIVILSLVVALTVANLPLADPLESNLDARLLPPLTPAHLLGTDALGRDILSRIVWGIRPALIQGLVTVSIATLLGYFVGAIPGFWGGNLDTVVMRPVDAVLAIPPLMMAIAVAAILGPGLTNAVIAMTIVMIAPMARVARGAVLHAKHREYVLAARAVGVSSPRIFLRHIVPNTITPVLAYALPLIGIMIVFGSGLSFIGLGIQPPTPDWGRMVNEGRTVLATSPFVPTFPGLAIFLLGLGFILVGDWLESLLDPHATITRPGP